MTHAKKNVRRHPSRNRGAALLLLLFMVVVVFSTVLVTSLLGTNPELQRQQKSLEALAQAKQALIAWSVMQGDVGTGSNPRPGSLPCPDTNYFGTTDSGNAAGSCSSDGGTSIGRLPWKTIDTSRLRDAGGETLWYAVSDKFRKPSLNNDAINSDTKGSLLLYATDGSTLSTPTGEELAAIVIAPGSPLPGQDRAASPNAASSYLEAFNGKSNADAAGPFVMGPAKDADGNLVVNDLVVGITARELVTALERRALNEAQAALKQYLATQEHYPNPAPPGGLNCDASITNVNVAAEAIPKCAGDSSTCFGRLPEDTLVLPLWFLQNAWGRVMTYAIHDAGAGCPASLNVGGETRSYVLIAPGSPRGGQNRPSTSLADYLEDPANTDAWSADPNFATPSINSNDQLKGLP